MKEREMPRFRNHYEKVDMNTWKRAEHCRSFRKYLNLAYYDKALQILSDDGLTVMELAGTLT